MTYNSTHKINKKGDLKNIYIGLKVSAILSSDMVLTSKNRITKYKTKSRLTKEKTTRESQ